MFMRTNKLLLTAIFFLLIILGWFYWFQWRPSEARKYCANKILSIDGLKRSDVKPLFDLCLHKQGF